MWRWQWTNSEDMRRLLVRYLFGGMTLYPILREQLPIDLPAMANLKHDYLAAFIAHEVDHPIIALPDPVLVIARQLLAARWAWICRQSFHPTNNPPAIFPGDRFQLFDRRRFDEEPIGVHAASGL